MTENEARKTLEIFDRERKKYMTSMPFTPYFDRVKADDFTMSLNIAIESLKEIQQYRAIGTVEECREAMERQGGKQVVCRSVFTDGTRLPGCPICFSSIDRGAFYCSNCGQKLDWSE